MPKYLGPSQVFIYGGKEYHQGDDIPMNKTLVAHHEEFGHRFDNTDVDAARVRAENRAASHAPAPVADADEEEDEDTPTGPTPSLVK